MKKDTSTSLIMLLLFIVGAVYAQTVNQSPGIGCFVANCKICSDYNFCGLCQDNFMLSFNEKGEAYCAPVQCNIENCALCLRDNMCEECQPGFFIQGDRSCGSTQTVSSYQNNCLCANSASSECLQCITGYIVKDGICIIQVPGRYYNCQIYLNPYYCLYCSSSYYPSIVDPRGYCSSDFYYDGNYFDYIDSSGNSTACNTIENCAYCNQTNACSDCIPGYQLADNNTCVKSVGCSPYCLKCQGSACLECISYLKQVNGDCIYESYANLVPNCLVPSQSDSYYCIVCQKGYNRMNNYTCAQSATDENCLVEVYSGYCVYCNNGYVLTQGICMPQVANYPCLPNCVFCSAPYYCTLCQNGYLLQGTICILPPLPIPNCLQYDTMTRCQICEDGFFGIYCFSNSLVVACEVVGCTYCLEANICTSCRSGYNQVESKNGGVTCEPQCSIQNCLLCAGYSITSCEHCADGLNQDNNCQPYNCSEQNPTSSCSQYDTNTCQCVQCDAGFALDQSNYCCLGGNQFNMMGCLEYSGSCGITNCIKCEMGYFLANGDCFHIPCNIQNCQFCFRSQTCFVCESGFALIEGQCTAFTPANNCPANCLECNSNGQCTACNNGLKVHEGVCVCPFQNCLECLGGALCYSCAAPFVPTIIQGGGCILPPVPKLICEIDNCVLCSYPNQCSVCFLGFTPQNGTCVQNQCSAGSNCLLCDTRICFTCKEGYIQNGLLGENCIPVERNIECLILGCTRCSSQNTCAECLIGTTLIKNSCQPNTCERNCAFCLEESQCLVCNSYYYLANNGSCLAGGNSFSNNIFGYRFNGIQAELCQAENCQLCLTFNPYSYHATDVCVLCDQGYFLNNYLECSPYILPPGDIIAECTGIDVCLYCAYDNVCAFCPPGWTLSSEFTGSDICVTSLQNICQPNCLSCTLPEICVQCASGFQLVKGVGRSYSCYQACSDPFILSISSDTCGCPTQESPYIAQYNTQQLQLYKQQCSSICTLQYCSICSNPAESSGSQECLECLSGFDLVYDYNEGGETVQCTCDGTLLQNTCISCDVNLCTSCFANNLCESCESGSEPNLNNQQCVTCAIQNCQFCSSDDYCAICQPGFQYLQVSFNTSQCISCSGIQGCQSCSIDNICSQCLTGYTLNSESNTCFICSYPCQTCNDDGSCETCQSPFVKIPNPQNNQCYTCEVQNCISCSPNNTLICTECLASYQPTQDGNQCELVCGSSLCTKCSNDQELNKIICEACIPGYYLNNNNNQCQQCTNAPQCLLCNQANPAICNQCAPGFYLKRNICTACPGNCETCQPASSTNKNVTCLTFKPNTKQFSIQIDGVDVPAVCQFGCNSCKSLAPSICIQCDSGFALNSVSSVCVPCPEGCTECILTNSIELTFKCLSCYGNGFLIEDVCQTCNASSNCLTCQSANLSACATCPTGYYLGNGICEPGCPENCLTCSSNVICSTCVPGFVLNAKNKCVPCLSSCRQCAPNAPGQCLSCGQGLFLNTQQKCQACSASFCKTCSVNNVCTTCISGYTLSTAFTCVQDCINPCATCSSNSPSACLSCLAGYTFDQTTSQCLPSTSCSGNCTVCPMGYVLNDKNCLKCSNSQCSRCTPSKLDVCTSCISGMFFTSSQNCQSCPTGCATCSSSKNCLTCSSGFTLLSQPVKGTQQMCVACSSPCAQCTGNPATCLTCVSGYTLSGWKCISNFNFQVQMTLNADPEDFYQNYDTFLQQLANAIAENSNIDIVSVNSIEQGSTIVNAQVLTNATPGSQEATTQQNSLQSLTSEGQTVAGMNVESSAFTVNGDSSDDNNGDNNNDDDQGSSGPSLGLILGICIPLAVLVIGIIVYCLVVKNSSDPAAGTGMDTTSRGVHENFEMKETEIRY